MAAKKEEPKKKESKTVPGYSGSAQEGKGASKPPSGVKVPKEGVVSPAGVATPTEVFKGDGTTPAEKG